MPIRHFDFYLAERKLIHTDNLSSLKGIRLGIDGSHWLKKLLGKDSYSVAMGGAPWNIKQVIDKELQNFENAEITPIFVFSGLNIAKKEKPFLVEDTRLSKRSAGWDSYEKNNISNALSCWSTSTSGTLYDLTNYVIWYLNSKNVEWIRAPFSALPQLAYLQNPKRNYIHTIFSSSDILVYDVERIIVALDLEQNFYNWIDKQSVLSDIRINDEQMIDLALLAGCETCSTFPPIAESFNFKHCSDLFKQYKNGFQLIQAFIEHPQIQSLNYLDLFCRGKCIFKFHLILNDFGVVEPLNKDDAPKYVLTKYWLILSDLHDIISHRLPNSLYFYLFQGLIGPQVLNSLLSGSIVESPPLCNGDSKEYRTFIKELLPLRAQTLHLLSQHLHPFFRQKKIVSIYWFDPESEVPLIHDFEPSLYDQLKWNIPIGSFKKGADFVSCLKSLSSFSNSNQAQQQKLVSVSDVLASVLYRILELRSFIGIDHTITLNGTFLMTSLPEFQQELFLVVELIRLKMLHHRPYGKLIENEPEEAKHLRLTSRVACLLTAKESGNPWNGPLSKEILMFVSVLNSLTRTMKNYSEMILLSLFMHGHVQEPRDDYADINQNLPFNHYRNTSMGLLFENYVQLANENTDVYSELQKRFPSCSDIKNDISRTFRLWKQVFNLVTNLSKQKEIPDTLYNEYVAANQWLAAYNKE